MRHLANLTTITLLPFLSAQSPDYLPGTTYDPAVPTLRATVGHDFGERISSHAETERYLRALADASPRIQLVEYGTTWEGRALYYLVIGSEEAMQRIDAIRADVQRLADPRELSSADVDALVAELPAVVWLAYAVHGNEISGTDAALLTAYHLVAAREEQIAQLAGERCIVIIDPLQNPDGRDRFVHHYRQTRGRWADPDARAAEHNEAWPGGRTNHYLFDMNRDWIALTQPETRGRVRAFLEWYPHVYVDLHEMGSNSTYYFPPPADPINPQFTATQLQWLERFGRNNARWFDRMGFDYFTREVFDAFYPGYGEGWPTFHGAIGMTYEQASVRGLVVEREDETRLDYRASVQHHFVASLATIETAARDREQLLRDFAEFRRGQIEPTAKPVAGYLLPPGRDPNRTAKLVAILMAQGVEVEQADDAFRAARVRDYGSDEVSERELPAGTYRISLAQPAARLVQTLLAPQQEVDEAFAAEQERRRGKRLPTQFYDVTAWSMPLLYDVECLISEERAAGSFRRLESAPGPVGQVPDREAALAYLVPWGTNSAARALAAMLRQELRVHCADKPFTQEGREYRAGTLIVKRKGNPADLHARLTGIAAESGAELVATDSAWVEEGIGFGSNNVKFLEPPVVALAYDRPTSAYSVGWTRHLLEQSYGYPVTIIRTRQIAGADLSKYDVLVLPSSSGYASALASARDSIVTWIRAGGTLVTLGEATRWLTGEKVGLLATAREDKKAAPEQDPDSEKTDAEADPAAKPEQKPEPFDLEAATRPDKEPPDRTPGAILRIDLDPEHWLAFGYDGGANVLVGSHNIFTPVKLDKGRNVGVYRPLDSLVLSGFTWGDAAEQLAQKAYLVHQPHGKGHVVAFAEDPNFRGFCDGLNLLFLNAVFFGPGH